MNPRLVARGLGVTRERRELVAGVDLALPAGRLVALIGPNGAGKTTLIKALAGLIIAKGSVFVGGADLSGMSRRDRARRIAYLPQGHQVHWPLRAREIVALGRYPHGLADPARPSGEDCLAIEAAIARVDIADLADRPMDTLSGGERARVMLARVLATGAEIILADEPIAALDPRHQLAVMNDLKTEAGRGTLVIVITHDLGLASRLADHLLLMQAGRIVAEGPPAEVLTDDRLATIYGIRAIRHRSGSETAVMAWSLAP
jgi:iron complex transport system ATP-binding protein